MKISEFEGGEKHAKKYYSASKGGGGRRVWARKGRSAKRRAHGNEEWLAFAGDQRGMHKQGGERTSETSGRQVDINPNH